MTPIPRLSAGAGSAQNAQHREKMEDAHSVLENFQNNPNQGFFAVYDGHAGAHTANWCQKYFHQEFLTILDKFNPLWPIPTILAETFIIGDKRLISQPGYDSSGSTASVVFIKSEDDGHSRTLYTANVGDSRIILCTNGRAEILSRDHNLEDKRENDRVRANGGFIARNRVDGMLAITRAIGDSGFKPYVSSSPYTTEIKLDQSQDEFVIIATDGLWDVCDNQTAVDLIRDIDDSDKASKLLIDYAMEHGSSDNITVIVIRLSDSISPTNKKTKELDTIFSEADSLASSQIVSTVSPPNPSKIILSPSSSKAIPLLKNIIAKDAINANLTQRRTSVPKLDLTNNKNDAFVSKIADEDISPLSLKQTVDWHRIKRHDTLYDSRHPTIPIPVLDARDRRNSLFEEKISSLTANVLDLSKYQMSMGYYSETREYDNSDKAITANTTTTASVTLPTVTTPLSSGIVSKTTGGFDFGANLPPSPPTENNKYFQPAKELTNGNSHFHNSPSSPKESAIDFNSVSSSERDYHNSFFYENQKQNSGFSTGNDAFLDSDIVVRVDDHTSYGSMSPMLLEKADYHPRAGEYSLHKVASINLSPMSYSGKTSPISPPVHQRKLAGGYNRKTRHNGYSNDYSQEQYRSGFIRKEIPLIFDYPMGSHNQRRRNRHFSDTDFGRSPLNTDGSYGGQNFNMRVENAVLSDDD